MTSLRNRIFLLLTSGKYTGIRDDTAVEVVIRLMVLNIIYTIASVVILALGVSAMRDGRINEGLLQITMGFMIFVNLFLLKTELPFIVGGLIVTTIFGAFCGVSIFTNQEMHGFTSLWIYAYPFMSIFALGLPVGLIPAGCLFLVTIGGTLIPGLKVFPYTLPEAVLICGVYFFVLVLTVVYEGVRAVKDRWLSRQDSYMNMVFANSPDIIILLDEKDNFIYCADIFLRRTHIQSFDLLRKQPFREIFSRFQRGDSRITGALQKAVEEGNPVVIEETLDLGNDRVSRNYEIHFTPMFNRDRIYQGAFILFQDMTEILAAKQRAEQASIAKTNFLATISHEIRTPLNAIQGMTTIAKGTRDNDRRDYCLDKIEIASAHLLGTINDILDMSKLEMDRIELFNSEFEFVEMLRQVTRALEFRINEKKQTLKILVEGGLPHRIVSDEQRLAQIITNLLTNAIKFTSENGSISINVRKLKDDLSGSEAREGLLCTGAMCILEVRVTDTGIGIPADQRDRIFQSFEQADSSKSRKFGGIGLGLAISKRIVEMMNGAIRLESELGQGSSFIFTIQAEEVIEAGDAGEISFTLGRAMELPSEPKHPAGDAKDTQGGEPIPAPARDEIPEAPAEEPASGEMSGEDTQDEEADFSGHRILLVEDVEINREIVITILEPTGLGIDEAENGQDAYDKFSADPAAYDLIFMDIHMPGMDGYEATRKIRAMDRAEAKEIPIIAMTANVFKEDVERCLDAGMNSHIGKPLDFGDVMKALRKYLTTAG